MTSNSGYITALESKISIQKQRINELAATLMLLIFNEANPVNRDYLYLQAARQVYAEMPMSNDLINEYNRLLNEPGAKI